MSALPHFDACLVCDTIRPELNGKLIILGFLGVCPNVDIGIVHLDQPSIVTFLIYGGPGEGAFSATVSIVDESDGRTIAQTTSVGFTPSPITATTLAPSLLLTFGHAGDYSLRLLINEREHFRADFRVSQGVPSFAAI